MVLDRIAERRRESWSLSAFTLRATTRQADTLPFPSPRLLESLSDSGGRLQAVHELQKLLIRTRVLDDELGPTIDSQDNRITALLELAHKPGRVPLEIGEGMDVLSNVQLSLRIKFASFVMLTCEALECKRGRCPASQKRKTGRAGVCEDSVVVRAPVKPTAHPERPRTQIGSRWVFGPPLDA